MANIIKSTLSDDVLDKTMLLFWKRGYSNTSIADITDITGMNRATLYKYIGGKDELFIEMLKRFRANIANETLTTLQNSTRGIVEIHTYFNNLRDAYNKGLIHKMGCFMVASASEMSLYNKDVSIIINDFIQCLGDSFKKLLLTSKQEGALNNDINADHIANFLVGNFIGLMTLCRTSINKNVFESHVCGIMDFLQSLTAIKLPIKRAK